MRLLVIENFTEKRPDRQRLWDGLVKKFGARLEIEFCRQEKTSGFLHEADGEPFRLGGYDLVFIHAGDKHYNPSENYVDLAKAEGHAFVCYSGGAESVVAPRLRELQIEEMPLDVFGRNVGFFLDRLAGDGTLTPEAFYLLADFDPRLEATYSLLQMFLPLDLALQIRDLEECRAQAALLLKNKERATELLREATGEAAAPESGGEGARATGDGPQTLLGRLWTCAENVSAAGDFHRNFERLRDALFEIMRKGE